MNSINIAVYSKHWKRTFTIAYIDSYGYAVDTLGVQHDPKALRATKPGDTMPRDIGIVNINYNEG